MKLTPTEVLSAATENLEVHIDADENHPDKFVLLTAAMEINRAVKDYETVQQTIADASEGWKYDWSHLIDAVDAELRVKLWSEIVAASSESEEPRDMTVTVKVLRAAAKSRARQLLNNWGGTSSSGMSNAIDKQQSEVNARFVSYFAGDEATIKEVI